MALLESLNSLTEGILELVVDYFLSTPLHKVLRVILSHLRVGRGGEADYRSGSSVADIDTDQHGSHVLHSIWELHPVKIASDLAVDLAQDI